MNARKTIHASKRMSQRAISDESITCALMFGRVIYAAGARFIFLAARDVPPHLRRQQERLEGLTLVLASAEDRVITVFRNRAALNRIKRLEKIDRSRRREHAPRRGFR